MKSLLHFFRWLFRLKPKCDHQWSHYGLSFVECEKCGVIKENRILNKELFRKFMMDRIDKGCFTKEQVNKALMNNGLFKRLL